MKADKKRVKATVGQFIIDVIEKTNKKDSAMIESIAELVKAYGSIRF